MPFHRTPDRASTTDGFLGRTPAAAIALLAVVTLSVACLSPAARAATTDTDMPSHDMASHDMPDGDLHATSENGLYTATATPLEMPVPLNRIHTWRVHIVSDDGVAVTDANITVSGGMPMHDHGLPTAPRARADSGDGDYLLEGVKFQMPGHWVVELQIDAPAGTDTVVLDLTL